MMSLIAMSIIPAGDVLGEYSYNSLEVLTESGGRSFCTESFENAYMTGYKKGMEDTVAQVQKNEPANTLNVINRLGDIILKETSVETLLTLKKNVNEVKAQNPDLSIFRVYNILIDDRLRELRNEVERNKKSKNQKSK